MQDSESNRQVWILIRNDVRCEPRFDPQIAKAAVAAFANELRIMDHAPISIDLSQFFQKKFVMIPPKETGAPDLSDAPAIDSDYLWLFCILSNIVHTHQDFIFGPE